MPILNSEFQIAEPLLFEVVMNLLAIQTEVEPKEVFITYMIQHNLTVRRIGNSLWKSKIESWKKALDKLSEITGYDYEELGVPAGKLKQPEVTLSEREISCIQHAWSDLFKKIKNDINQKQVFQTLQQS